MNISEEVHVGPGRADLLGEPEGVRNLRHLARVCERFALRCGGEEEVGVKLYKPIDVRRQGTEQWCEQNNGCLARFNHGD